MKKFLILISFVIICFKISAQQKKETFINKNELAGTWQKDFARVGNGLVQNFQFFKNGKFILNFDVSQDDARSITKLKGTYRLVGDKLFFTITSKTIIYGELEMAEPAVSMSLFEFGNNSKVKEVMEENPKEMLDPCFITYIKARKIKLNNEVYYKIND